MSASPPVGRPTTTASGLQRRRASASSDQVPGPPGRRPPSDSLRPQSQLPCGEAGTSPALTRSRVLRIVTCRYAVVARTSVEDYRPGARAVDRTLAATTG